MGKNSGHRTKGSGKSRRETVLRNVPKHSFSLDRLLRRPEFLITCLIVFLFLVVVSTLTTWSKEQIMVQDGQIATDTRITRLDYAIEDFAATEANREEARRSSPRIYIINDTFIERIHASLLSLPNVVAGKTKIEAVNSEHVDKFHLTADSLDALQGMYSEGEATSSWRRSVLQLTKELRWRRPLLTSEEYQVFISTPPANMELILDGKIHSPYEAVPAELGDEPDPKLAEFISKSGFPDSVIPQIESRLISDNQASIHLDIENTQTRAAEAADAVESVVKAHNRGDPIWRRGDVISASQYEEALLEQQQFWKSASFWERWFPRIGSIGLLIMLSIFIGVYTTVTTPRIAKNPLRLFAMFSLMSMMLGLSVFVTLKAPNFIYAAAIVPTLLVVTIACLAYGQRMGLFIAFMQCAMVTMSLSQSIGWYVLLIAGCGIMIGQLNEVRQRQTLIQGSAITAAVFTLGSLFLGLAEVPDLLIAWQQVLTNSLIAGASALTVGFFVLGILPSIERVFDITTGMTLADLRDPRNPLIRQLQQLAPGTFNHSRQVADIAETATEAIGGDSLLAYVGGLFHDIGKMNKPEYFVENQSGYNRHRDLKPSMSLLIIIGHVKDGVELAKEHDLPREIVHFIESHHGTSLVEYFYHTAMKEAKDSGGPINESQFRYPGPRPKTKEAAVLMVADAVESAARAMSDPNPARVEALVRDLSRKRLLDHQFDECGLTFRDLAKIEDAIITRLNAIYHTRIQYPEVEDVEEITEVEEELAS